MDATTALVDYLPTSLLSLNALFLFLVIITTFLYIYISLSFRKALPPGPPRHYLMGNILPPNTKPFLHFTALSQIYGPITTFFFGPTPTIIISSPHTAHSLLTLRSQTYSSRPRSVVFGEIYSKGLSIIVTPSGPSHNLRRKLLSHSLNPTSFQSYKGLQLAESSVLLAHILGFEGKEVDGKDWVAVIDRYTASIVFTMGYGRRIAGVHSEVVRKRREYTAFMGSLMVPGAYKAEMFPWLAKIPEVLASWKKRVREMGDRDREFNRRLVDSVREDLKDSGGVGTGCLTEYLLEWHQTGGKGVEILGKEKSADLLTAVPTTLFTAGSDTTSSTLQAVIFALVTHPEVLKTAQQETDVVMGPQSTSSPTFDTLKTLPYISAIITETLRWRPVFPLGLPHATTSPDEYQNYHIPANTRVLANVYAINHHPDFYPCPSLFVPERHLPPSDPRARVDLKGEVFPGRWEHGTFGYGKRVCMGAELAVETLRVAVAKMIWGFDVRLVEGRRLDMEDWGVWTEGVILKPKPFGIAFELREGAERGVIERERGEAEQWLGRFKCFE